MWNIIKDNNQDLSFAMDCLSIGAISVSEFKSWLEIVIRDNPIDDIPGYIFDILDSNNIKLDIYKILGFSLSTVLSKQERKAVYGIAYTRRPDYGAGYDVSVSKSVALKALQNNPKKYWNVLRNSFLLLRFERVHIWELIAPANLTAKIP